jgi:hypothetical protein
VRLIKDLDAAIDGRDVLIVEDVVDTGLTLHYLVRTFRLRSPRSLAAVTFLDRPYRRLVEDLPVRYVGFTVPDEFFVGYGFDAAERYRNLPDLHVYRGCGKRGGTRGSPTSSPSIPGGVRASGDETDQPEHEHDRRDDPQEVDREPNPEEQGRKQQNYDQCKHGFIDPLVAVVETTLS